MVKRLFLTIREKQPFLSPAKLRLVGAIEEGARERKEFCGVEQQKR
jgi:hypothetical protein